MVNFESRPNVQLRNSVIIVVSDHLCDFMFCVYPSSRLMCTCSCFYFVFLDECWGQITAELIFQTSLNDKSWQHAVWALKHARHVQCTCACACRCLNMYMYVHALVFAEYAVVGVVLRDFRRHDINMRRWRHAEASNQRQDWCLQSVNTIAPPCRSKRLMKANCNFCTCTLNNFDLFHKLDNLV